MPVISDGEEQTIITSVISDGGAATGEASVTYLTNEMGFLTLVCTEENHAAQEQAPSQPTTQIAIT